MEASSIVVSIICNTYNHSKYIRKAIEGFVNQKTNFKYEILIHDDASTDKTADIIRQYEAEYPDVIKPVYQKENLYSKNVKITPDIQLPRVRGKYIAICEGDDFWINENKLQKQIDYIEKNPECAMCITATQTVGMDSSPLGELHPFLKTGDYRIPDYLSRNSNIPTASILTRTEDLIAAYETPYRKISNVGDVPISLYMFSKGYVHYEDCCDVAYRINNPNSWVGQNKGEKKYIKHLKNSIEVHKTFDEYTEGKYANHIEKVVRKKEVEIYILEKKFNLILKEYKDVVKHMSLKEKAYIYIGAYAPFLVDTRKIRRK